jgi:opioid growth factor receptor-like protein
MSEITSFLTGTGTDHRGRRLRDILQFGDDALEAAHDYIQWLFPIPEKSAFNPWAPVLTSQDIDELRRNPDALENLRAAAGRMLEFYRNNAHWLTATDHNHLRISRIIRSLKLIAGLKEAERFYGEIMELVNAAGSPVSANALAHWRRACAAP